MTTIIRGPERFHGIKFNNTTKCRGDFIVASIVFPLILQFELLLKFPLYLKPKSVCWCVSVECVEFK